MIIGGFNPVVIFLPGIRCSKESLVQGLDISPDKDSYDFNETVYFHCGEEQMVYGSHSARCAQNGWEYDSPSLPMCGRKWVMLAVFLNAVSYMINQSLFKK